jgi:hypothetical protein
MLSFSPIVDPARDVLNVQVRHVSTLVGWATLVVAIGVALEGVELLHDAIAWIKRRRLRAKELAVRKELKEIFPAGEVRLRSESHSDHPRWVKRFTRIGLILVVAGVLAEWRCGSKLEDAHNAVHEYDLAKLTEADQKAGEARDSALSAKASEKALEEKAAGLTLRMEAASRQLGQLERDITAQGPRAPLIEKAAPELVKTLLPFAGQKVALYVCTSAELRSQEREMIETWGRIADVLGDKGAHWSMPHSNLMFWKQEFACDGIQIGSSSRSPQRTKDAVKALSDALFKVLPPSTDNMSGTVDPDFILRMLKRGLEREDAPWTLEAKEPDLIAVMIGRHPVRGVTKQSKIAHKTHK